MRRTLCVLAHGGAVEGCALQSEKNCLQSVPNWGYRPRGQGGPRAETFGVKES